MKKQKLVVFSGSGISAESGINTFRDSGGLWENYRIEDVATPQAWQKNKQLVLAFYNQRRKQVLEAVPNLAHKILCELENKFEVVVITQNVDDLHERAGSRKVIHLHGELLKSRSTVNPNLIYPINGWELNIGDKCELGSQLRPHIVWFGEMVPEMENAIFEVKTADIFVVIGTSLQVYPAASLIYEISDSCKVFLVDPADFSLNQNNLMHIKEKAVAGMQRLKNILIPIM